MLRVETDGVLGAEGKGRRRHNPGRHLAAVGTPRLSGMFLRGRGEAQAGRRDTCRIHMAPPPNTKTA